MRSVSGTQRCSPCVPARVLCAVIWITFALVQHDRPTITRNRDVNTISRGRLTHGCRTIRHRLLYIYQPRAAPERIFDRGGGTGPARSAGKFFWVVPLHSLALKVQLVVLVRAGQFSTVLSVSYFLFFYSRCPLCPAICKSWGHLPPPRAPLSRRHCQPRINKVIGPEAAARDTGNITSQRRQCTG